MKINQLIIPAIYLICAIALPLTIVIYLIYIAGEFTFYVIKKIKGEKL